MDRPQMVPSSVDAVSKNKKSGLAESYLRDSCVWENPRKNACKRSISEIGNSASNTFFDRIPKNFCPNPTPKPNPKPYP